MTIRWAGVFHVLATPLTDDGELDLAGLPHLVDGARGAGVDGLTVQGIAGEAHRLTDEERRRVVQGVVKEARGRVPVVVGISAPGTHLARALGRMAREHGADAVMVAPPQGLRNLDAVAAYYQDLGQTAGLPLVVQDEPVTTQVVMPAPFLARLCAEVPGVQAVKLEEVPSLPKVTALRKALPPGIAIFGGMGGVYLYEELARGATGAMTGFPYPEPLRVIVDHWHAGRRAAARDLFYRWLPLIRYETQPGSVPGVSLAIRKEILRRRGWLRTAVVRPPTPALDPGVPAELDELLAAVGA
jgi:4-hydroxy-tetrahydrodipicolinate synthase